MGEVTNKSPTQKLYVAAARAIKGEASFDKFTHIALDEGDMSGFTEATNSLASECTKSGLSRVAATVTLYTTVISDDTVQAYHQFTAGEPATISGFGVFAGTGGANMLMWGEFDSPQVLQTNDKLGCSGRCQFKLGS